MPSGPVRKPAGSRVSLESSGGKLDIDIPPQRLSSSNVGTGLFALAWNAFVAFWTVRAGLLLGRRGRRVRGVEEGSLLLQWGLHVVAGSWLLWLRGLLLAEAHSDLILPIDYNVCGLDVSFATQLHMGGNCCVGQALSDSRQTAMWACRYAVPVVFVGLQFSAIASGGILFALFSAPFWFAGYQLAGQALGGALTHERFAIGRKRWRLAQVRGGGEDYRGGRGDCRGGIQVGRRQSHGWQGVVTQEVEAGLQGAGWTPGVDYRAGRGGAKGVEGWQGGLQRGWRGGRVDYRGGRGGGLVDAGRWHCLQCADCPDDQWQ